MLKLGIIGTGAISHHFIEAAHTSQEFQLVAVYSRASRLLSNLLVLIKMLVYLII